MPKDKYDIKYVILNKKLINPLGKVNFIVDRLVLCV